MHDAVTGEVDLSVRSPAIRSKTSSHWPSAPKTFTCDIPGFWTSPSNEPGWARTPPTTWSTRCVPSSTYR